MTIHPDDIDPDTGRPYRDYSSPSLDTSFHDHEMDVDDEEDEPTTAKIVLKSNHSIEMVGTLETLTGRAGIQSPSVGPDGKIAFEWAGSTEIFWDDQRTVLNNGHIVFVTEDGQEFPEDECEVIAGD